VNGMWRTLRAVHNTLAGRRPQVWELITAGLGISAAYEGAGLVCALAVGAGLAALKTYEADR
jgi:hypothetical protein